MGKTKTKHYNTFCKTITKAIWNKIVFIYLYVCFVLFNFFFYFAAEEGNEIVQKEMCGSHLKIVRRRYTHTHTHWHLKAQERHHTLAVTESHTIALTQKNKLKRSPTFLPTHTHIHEHITPNTNRTQFFGNS